MLGSQWPEMMTGTAGSVGASVGASDGAEEFWAASGSQHSAAQIAATSGSVAQRSAVASIAQNSVLAMLVPQLAPDCKVGLGLGDEVAGSSCRRCWICVTEGLEAERSSEERPSLTLELFSWDSWLEEYAVIASNSSTEAPTAIVTQCRIDIRMIDLVQPWESDWQVKSDERERGRNVCQLG